MKEGECVILGLPLQVISNYQEKPPIPPGALRLGLKLLQT